MKLTTKKVEHIGKRRGGFTILPNGLDELISSDALMLMYIISSNSENFFSSLGQIQKRTGWAKQKWNKIILELKEKGFINVDQHKGMRNGEFNYTLTIDVYGGLEPQGKMNRAKKEEEVIIEPIIEPEPVIEAPKAKVKKSEKQKELFETPVISFADGANIGVYNLENKKII